MKIDFEDKSYIECKKKDDKIVIIVSAKDGSNANKRIVNAVEITPEEFKQLISEIEL
jgi:hypothetical protein